MALVVLVPLAASIGLAGCAELRDPYAGSHDLLAQPAGEQARFSVYEPEAPFEPLVRGLLDRTRFAAGGVELHDLLVGPRQTTDPATFPQAVLITVVGGQGRMEITGAGGQRVESLEAGAAFMLQPGDRFTIVNRSDSQIDIDLTLFAGP